MRAFSVTQQQRLRRSFVVFLALFRAFTVLLALQFSGVIHDATDVVQAVARVAHREHEQCPPDGPCEDCPPGCPNCHCASVGGAVAAVGFASLLAPLSDSLPAARPAAQAPLGPEPSLLFRPPQA
ncbi:MAG TPA: hypothetical protein VEQ58_07585 [Polyangiaceae bacterium]|nr:hypothetical protein [Polyangiaceae bacterium]